jgi:hypothetical protein
MPFAAEGLLRNQNFLAATLHSARELMAIYAENPRIAAIFATQQKWLLAHSGYALYLGHPDDPVPGLYVGRLADFAVKHDISSWNTAVAFLKEMVAYRFCRPVAGRADRRIALLEPTEMTQAYMTRWIETHLSILDMLDGGNRIARSGATEGFVAKMQPLIAKRIVDSKSIRDPGPTFSLFNWATSGGVVMDYLFSRVTDIDPGSDRISIGPISPKAIQGLFMISSAHLKRLFKQATDVGSVGWTGSPGRSEFWLSREFMQEYWGYQAQKYAIVDSVSEAVLDLPNDVGYGDADAPAALFALSA